MATLSVSGPPEDIGRGWADFVGPQGLGIALLRPMRLIWNGAELRIGSRPGRQLLGYLALTPAMAESRERLAALIWGETGETAARQNLRQSLYDLRTQLPPPVRDLIVADRDRVALDRGRLVTDEGVLLAALDRGEVPEPLLAVPALPQHLLDGLQPVAETFESWLRLRRRDFEEQIRSRLAALMASGAPDTALRASRGLLQLDPSDEAAARFMIRHAAAAGDTARALRLYRDLWDLLDAEFGMEPADETQALIVAVKQGGIPTARAAPQPPAPVATVRRPRLRIEPLVTDPAGVSPAGPAAGQDLASTLFRADLVARLARFRALTVIDADVADRPGDYCLRLIARSADQRVALTASIIASDSGEVIWSHRADHLSRDWQRLRETIAGSIAAACDISVARARLAAVATPGGDAIDEWLRGQQCLDEFRPGDWQQAEQHFRAASALDPGFAKAYSSRAQVRNIRHLVFPGLRPDPQVLSELLAFANRAVAADPFDAEAHLCRAWASLLLCQYAQAETSFDLALRSNPDEPWTVISSALGYAFIGRPLDAARLAERSRSEGWTTSRSAWGYHANIRFLAGDLEGCVVACDNAGDAILNLPAWSAAALALLDRPQDAARKWAAFEAAARPYWVGTTPPDTEALFDWFATLFPIRNPADRDRLIAGARLAADAYLHWVTE